VHRAWRRFIVELLQSVVIRRQTASEKSHTRGSAMTSGWIILTRSKPALSDTNGVLVIRLGKTTLTVTQLLSRSLAMIALSASSAALEGP
jgi:hypothetical protein